MLGFCVCLLYTYQILPGPSSTSFVVPSPLLFGHKINLCTVAFSEIEKGRGGSVLSGRGKVRSTLAGCEHQTYPAGLEVLLSKRYGCVVHMRLDVVQY
jgi:hypothetical protein